MRVIPVIDLKSGAAVRGVAGRRAEYRPVVSKLTSSAQPVDVARAFRDCLGCTELYLADLDAIAGGSPTWRVYRQLQELGLQLWLDAGVGTVGQAMAIREAGVARIVVGLETVAGPDELETILASLPGLVFSLDLKDGTPLGNREAWWYSDAATIARQAYQLGVRTMILLDLARVGMGAGPGTETLCQTLRREFADLEIILGGGVRDAEDLVEFAKCGASAVLVASALHDGRITKADLTNAIRSAPTDRGLPPLPREADPG